MSTYSISAVFVFENFYNNDLILIDSLHTYEQNVILYHSTQHLR